jgi:hypothetical protein
MSDTGIDILVVPILGFSLVAFVVAILALIGRVAKRKWEAARADRLAETGRERDLYVITLIDRNDHRSVRVLFFDHVPSKIAIPKIPKPTTQSDIDAGIAYAACSSIQYNLIWQSGNQLVYREAGNLLHVVQYGSEVNDV